MKTLRGFTLIELLVVIAIIGILSSVVLTSLSTAGKKADDAKRLAEMQQLQKALSLYYDDNGVYPTTSNAWWGNCSNFGSHDTSGSNGWVPNLAPKYITTLPLDPKPIGNGGCYLYQSNGKDYMLLVYQTVESYNQATNKWPRPAKNGVSPNSYENDFAFYTNGASGW